ncbi:MAG: FHA domain-containing protein [Gammaproteobacteria bacterium]
MIAKLILTLDGAILKEYPVSSDSISIGRKHGNDIQLNDMTVSGRHALISTLVGNTYVEDLGSTNGTWLNGKRIRKLLLKHGDIIQVGAHQLTYFCEEKAQYEPTMFIKAEMAETQMMPDVGKSDGDAKGMPLAGIRILNGPMAKSVLELRKPFNTLGYKGIKLAMITRTHTGYAIFSVKGRKGRRATDMPLVNGKPIAESDRKLNDHDLIELAGFQMEFFFIR